MRLHLKIFDQLAKFFGLFKQETDQLRTFSRIWMSLLEAFNKIWEYKMGPPYFARFVWIYAFLKQK